MNDHPSFAAVYRAASRAAGGCAIEAGLVLKLADNECAHGRLAGDSTPACGCWPGELAHVTVLADVREAKPEPTRAERSHAYALRMWKVQARRARVAELYDAGVPIHAITTELESTKAAITHDIVVLQKAGRIGRRYRERAAA